MKSGARMLSIATCGCAGALLASPFVPLAGRDTYMVQMADGVRLATDVYLPAGAGPWPVILHRTPYNKNAVDLDYTSDGGYAVVVQDVRGMNASEGEARPFLDDAWCERQDGRETVDWIRAQPWCNGSLGTVGASAPGILALLLSGAEPEGLVAQVVEVAASNVFSQAVFQGGAFRESLVVGWLSGLGLGDFMDTIVQHPTDDDLWMCVNTEARFDRVDTSGLYGGGWYDIFLQGTINSFTGIQEGGGPQARGNQRLVIGPWTHGPGPIAGELRYNAPAAPVAYADPARWMAFWLKGAETGVLDDPPVCYYLMGDPADAAAPANVWLTSDTWPIPAREVALHLRAGGVLSEEPPGAAETPESYTFDPDDPVPTRGGANLNLPAGPLDQRPVEGRPDVLLYTSPVLHEPFTITGKVSVRLWVSSSALDTDFTAKLTDVYPDGRSMLVSDGILRMRHRTRLDQVELMDPGEVYEVEVDLWETALVFNRDHRIRLAISSSNSPRFEPNPNTGEPFRQHTRTVVAENTVYHDAARPSRIVFRVPDPEIEVTPGELDFGDVAAGDSETLSIAVRNGGKAALAIREIALSGDAGPDFEVTRGGEAAGVAPGRVVQATVRYRPSSAGPDGDTLVIRSNDPARPELRVSLSGNGVVRFLRGDCDGDGQLPGAVNDAIASFRYCFGGVAVPCLAACDTDGDGNPCTGVTDGLRILMYLFRGGAPLDAPFPACGPSSRPTDEDLGCERGCP